MPLQKFLQCFYYECRDMSSEASCVLLAKELIVGYLSSFCGLSTENVPRCLVDCSSSNDPVDKEVMKCGFILNKETSSSECKLVFIYIKCTFIQLLDMTHIIYKLFCFSERHCSCAFQHLSCNRTSGSCCSIPVQC